MAELIDLNINIGANTTDFEGSLQKAQNLLKQFEAALKKATSVGEINYLNTQIKNLNGTITGLNQQMNKVGRPTADATNALSNLSRVAQDAPYGFIGIANNLNPLLESFQRLQKESGSSSQALKSMVAGLTGPAGVGLALGVVSSLAVTYADEIAKFFQGPEAALKKFREELNKLNADIYKVVGQAQANRAIGFNLVEVITGGDDKAAKNALARLKDLFKESADIQNAKVGQDKKYYQSLINNAAVQQAAIGKEKISQDQLSQLYAKQREIIAQRNKELQKAEKLEATFGFSKKQMVDTEKQSINNKYKNVLADLDKQIRQAEIKSKEFVSVVSNFEQTGDTKKPPRSPIVNYAAEENKQLTLELAKMKALRDKMKAIGLEPIDLFKTKEETTRENDKYKAYFDKQRKDLLEESEKSGFGLYMQGLFKKDKNKLDEEEGERKRIEALTQSYYQFAQTISGTVTTALFDMYDAIQAGENPLQVIGQMFANIAKQIAAVVIQALILQALMEAFPALKGAFAAVGLIGDAVGKGKALNAAGSAISPKTSFTPSGVSGNNVSSNGQFVIKGQDLVLAMQRSNSSLNIIRG